MSNPEERACGREVGPDCMYMTVALHRWCTNEACCRRRGTSIPGVVKCPYYRPVEKSNWWENLLLTIFLLFYVVLTLTLTWSLP